MTNPQIEPTPARTELLRADQAQAALDNPLIAEALAAWEQEIEQSWKSSPPQDVAARERARMMWDSSQAFRKYLLTTLETGQLQRAQVQTQSRLQKVAGWLR